MASVSATPKTVVNSGPSRRSNDFASPEKIGVMVPPASREIPSPAMMLVGFVSMYTVTSSPDARDLTSRLKRLKTVSIPSVDDVKTVS